MNIVADRDQPMVLSFLSISCGSTKYTITNYLHIHLGFEIFFQYPVYLISVYSYLYCDIVVHKVGSSLRSVLAGVGDISGSLQTADKLYGPQVLRSAEFGDMPAY